MYPNLEGPENRQRYTLQNAHGQVPAGTELWVHTKDNGRTLVFELDDGTSFELDRGRWFLKGLTPAPRLTEDIFVDYMSAAATEELQAYEDALFFDALKKAQKGDHGGTPGS